MNKQIDSEIEDRIYTILKDKYPYDVFKVFRIGWHTTIIAEWSGSKWNLRNVSEDVVDL